MRRRIHTGLELPFSVWFEWRVWCLS